MDIQIDIKDERHFSDVAPVVDREDFAEEIKRLRSVLEIKLPLDEKHSSLHLSKPKEKQIETEIEISRKRLYLPVVFKKVIETVVFFNKVSDSDYSPAYLDSKSHGTFDKEGATPDETYFIVLSPGARDKDVIEAYQKYRDQLGNIKGVSDYKYIHRVWEINKNKPSLKKYRKWYLDTKVGKKPSEIANDETSNCPIKEEHTTDKNNKPIGCMCFTESTIRKGVATYESLVWKTRTS